MIVKYEAFYLDFLVTCPIWVSVKSGQNLRFLIFRAKLTIYECSFVLGAHPGSTVVKNLPAKAGDTRDVSSIPGAGRSPRGGNGDLLQYSCLENSMDRGAWRATVHGFAKSWTWLKWLSMSTHTCTYMLLLYTYRPEYILVEIFSYIII